MSSFQLSAPLRFSWSNVFFLRAQKTPPPYRGEVRSPRYHPAWTHSPLAPAGLRRLCPLSAVYRPPPRRSLLGQSDRSPARLRGEFGNVLAPVFHHAPALWSTAPAP